MKSLKHVRENNLIDKRYPTEHDWARIVTVRLPMVLCKAVELTTLLWGNLTRILDY
jgi:hypothetical protein